MDMDLDHPDSPLYEKAPIPDDDPPYWASEVRDDNKLITDSINNNTYVKEIHKTMAFATARMVEDRLLKKARDYQKRINDYIQRIPSTPDLFQGALVDLSSQMGHYLDKSQLFSDAKTVNTKDLSEEQLREAFNLHLWQLLEIASRIEPPLREKLLASVAQPLIQILPHQEQQQPRAGPLSIGRPNRSLLQPQAEILSISMPTVSPQQPQVGTLSPQEQQHPHPLSFGSPTLSLQQPRAGTLPIGSHLQQPRAGNLPIGSSTLSPQEQLQEQQQPLAGTLPIGSPTLSPQEQQYPHPLSSGSPTLSLQQLRAGTLPIGSHLQQPRAGNLPIGSPTLSTQEQPQEQQQPLAGTLSINSPTLFPEQQQLLSTDTIATYQLFK